MAHSSAIEMEPSTKHSHVSVDSVSETKDNGYSPEPKPAVQAYNGGNGTDGSTLRVSASSRFFHRTCLTNHSVCSLLSSCSLSP